MKEELCEKVFEVRRVSEIEMIAVVFEADVLRLVCCYASQIFNGKCEIRNCSSIRAVNPLEQEMKVVERVFEKMLCRIMTVDEM